MCVAHHFDGILAFCRRHHQRGGSVDIGARHGRQTSIGERHSGLLAVRQRPGHHAHQVVDTLGIGIERCLDVLADVVATAIDIIESLQDAVVHPCERACSLRGCRCRAWEPRSTSSRPSRIRPRSWRPGPFFSSAMVSFFSSKTSFFTAISELAASTPPTEIWATV